jgi:hypothetical protein
MLRSTKVNATEIILRFEPHCKRFVLFAKGSGGSGNTAHMGIIGVRIPPTMIHKFIMVLARTLADRTIDRTRMWWYKDVVFAIDKRFILETIDANPEQNGIYTAEIKIPCMQSSWRGITETSTEPG